MSKVAISEEYLTDIANSIREKLDTQDTYKVSEMSEAIDSISGGGGLDWSAIGYSEMPDYIQEQYDYAKEIYDNWDATQTSMQSKFSHDTSLVIMPLVDTSNITDMWSAFEGCSNLKSVPQLNTSKVNTIRNMFYQCLQIETIPLFDTSNVTTMRGAFSSCSELINLPQFNTSKLTNIQNTFSGSPKLSDTSLDNILKMCININSNYSRAKTLVEVGLTSTNYPASKIQSLPSYQNFINAGWTIGY